MVRLLIVLYDGFWLVRMTWYTDEDSVTTILDDVMSLSVLCMSDAMNNVLSNGNHTNDNNITIPSSFLSVVAVTVAVALSWVRCVYSTYSGTTSIHSRCITFRSSIHPFESRPTYDEMTIIDWGLACC